MSNPLACKSAVDSDWGTQWELIDNASITDNYLLFISDFCNAEKY